MIKYILSDFSRTLLFPKDVAYSGSLNKIYKELETNPDFDFFSHFAWNQELADLYVELRDQQQIGLGIFTTDRIQNDKALKPFMKSLSAKVFNLADVNGMSKDNSASYQILIHKIGLPADEILFVDDSEPNLVAAAAAGMHTVQYTNVSAVRAEVSKLNS